MVPQLVFLALILIGLGVSAAKHGEPKGDYNVLGFIFSAAINLGILYWGGFFTPLLG